MADPRSYPTSYAYDDSGRLTTITDAYENVTEFRYYDDGQIREVEDRRDKVRSFAYTSTNQVEFSYDEDRVPHQYRWDGPVVDFEMDRRGNLWDYDYDGMGRLTHVNLPGPDYESYS